jgi:hypothetical protein
MPIPSQPEILLERAVRFDSYIRRNPRGGQAQKSNPTTTSKTFSVRSRFIVASYVSAAILLVRFPLAHRLGFRSQCGSRQDR